MSVFFYPHSICFTTKDEKKRMILILRPGEAFLKSERIRRRWEKYLLKNIQEVLVGIDFSISKERGRIYIETKSRGTLRRLQWVPGITSISPAIRTEAEPPHIVCKAVKLAKRLLKPGMSFAVRARCINQPFSSRWLERELGSSILSSIPNTRVNLSNPSLTLEVEVRGKYAYVFCRRIPGTGGLPVGSGGYVSPICTGRPEEIIATWFMLKRGCFVQPIVFSSRAERVIKLLKKLHQPMKGMLVPSAPDRTWRGLAIRMKTAGELGKRMGSAAIVAGEWLDELRKELFELDKLCPLPVLRPLVGLSIEELKEYASNLKLPPPLPSELPPRESLNDLQHLCQQLIERAEEISINPYA
jgi:thiamine biosynthesis protein ThiI